MTARASGAPPAPGTTRPRLTRSLLASPHFVAGAGAIVPTPAMLALPERAVQFGTGAFLRGFVDYFLDVANHAGRFDGRIVAIGSTGSGRDRALAAQDGLFTLASRGTVDGRVVEEHRIVGSVSRALSAATEWDAVLACARDPELELVFSNTTEVGIALDLGDDPDAAPPRSFPGKLTRFLYERAVAFDHDAARGVVVLPCELIERNGARLREIVLALAERWALPAAFAEWVRTAVPFCDTLVDRIVPGSPPPDEAARAEATLGYADELLTTSETYRLYAIEADAATRARLRFADADPGIVIASDITPYRERKVRLLNGAHTAFVPAAILCGFETVGEAVTDPTFGTFVRRLVLDEIVPTVDAPGTSEFAAAVLDRFANPFVRHALLDITLQGTMKARVRNVPTILRSAQRTGAAPRSLAFGLAAHLLLLRGDVSAERRRAGLPVPPDDHGDPIRTLWNAEGTPPAARSDADVAELAHRACADVALWGADLSRVPGFADAVAGYLRDMVRDGVPAALREHLAESRQPLS